MREDEGLCGASRSQIATKRALDILGSLILLLILTPVLFAIALAVALTSAGPVIYVQTRVGKDAESFSFFKFRSMVDGAHDQRGRLIENNEADGPVFKIKDDPRITPVGRWLRRLSLDELPQLINVLAGSMSLVGPRPPLPEEVRLYTEWELQRLRVKPGLTCTWQVSGRSDIDFDNWIAMDIDYIRHWSLWLDIKLLLMTVPAVIAGRGAY